MGYYILPFSIILSCFMGVGTKLFLFSEFGMVGSSLFAFVFSGMIFAFSYETYLSNVNIWYDYENKNSQRRVDRWRKFLFKKYPDLERQFKDIRGLIGEISQKNEELSKLKNKKIELESKLENISNLLSNKKDEFISAESQYMGFTLNNVCTEEDNKMCEAQVFKKRVLKPNDERY